MSGSTITTGAPVHCLFLPVYHGFEKVKVKEPAANHLCDLRSVVDVVLKRFCSLNRGAVVTVCPRRPQFCSAHISTGGPRGKCVRDDSQLTVPTTELYVNELGPGGLRRTAVAASMLMTMDVVFLYFPDDAIMSSLNKDEVEAHVVQYLVPLLLGMRVRRIQCVTPNENVRALWEPRLTGVWKQHSRWETDYTTVSVTAAEAVASASKNDDNKPNPTGWAGHGVVATFVKELVDICAAPQSRLQAAKNAALPLRIAVLRRFDKIGVLVCQVLQGTIRVGDRVVSIHDPLRTCTSNRVVSLRTYPANVDVTEAFPGEQIGVMTEFQLTAQNAPRNKLSELPFLSLGQGDIMVRYHEGPQTQPCWLVATSDIVVPEGSDLTVYGYGGSAVMRVVQCNTKSQYSSLALTHLDPTWGQGLFVDAPPDQIIDAPTSTSTATAAPPSGGLAAPDGERQHDDVYRRDYATRTLLAATHSSSQGLRVLFPIKVCAARHRMWVHRFLVSQVAPRFQPGAADKYCPADINEVLQKWRAAFIPTPKATDAFKARFHDMVIDEVTRVVPKELLETCIPTTESHATVAALTAVMSPQMDVLMLLSRVPDRRLAMRYWDSVASLLTEDKDKIQTTYHSRRYFVLPNDRGPIAKDASGEANVVAKILMRSVRSSLWLQHVQKMVSLPDNHLELLDLQEGSGLIMDMLGPSPRRIRAAEEPLSDRKMTLISKSYRAPRAAILTKVLASPNGVSAATLYTALCGVYAAATPPPPTSTWSAKDHHDVWAAERGVHSAHTVVTLLTAAKGPVVLSHLVRWCLAAGCCIPRSLDTKQLATVKGYELLHRLTFVELETLYMTQWALHRRYGVALPLTVSRKIAHFLVLMAPS